MPPESPPPHPGRIVARLARQVELAVADVDLTLAQYRVLILLGEGTEAASALAEKLAVSRPSVTGVVDGLVARGLVTRGHDVSDRRRVGHDLTEDGRRMLSGADAQVDRRLREVAAHRPDVAAAAFAGLAPWRDALDAYRNARRDARRALREPRGEPGPQARGHGEPAR
ncbi:MAG: MarR family transcriptional regulator [Solirubrobacteraceae bacterium]